MGVGGATNEELLFEVTGGGIGVICVLDGRVGGLGIRLCGAGGVGPAA